MIDWNTFQATAAPGEQCYSWQHPETGQIRTWATGRLITHLESAKHPTSVAEMDVSRAEFFIKNRGIESHRLRRLAEAPDEIVLQPALIMRLPTGGPTEDPWDLFLDGHHRYVYWAMLRLTHYPLWLIEESVAEPFEFYNTPFTPDDVLDPSKFSGL